MNLSCKKVLIAFDLDDTLIAENVYLRAAFAEFASKGFATLDKLLEYNNAYAAINEQVCAEKQNEATEIYRSGEFPVEPVPGAKELLNLLASTGAALAVITDGWSRRQRSKLRYSGLEAFFSDIYISEEHGNKDKITGEPFRILSETYPGYKKFYIGDNPSKDFIKAKEFGWTTVMVRNPALQYVHPATIPSEEHAPDYTVCALQKLSLLAGEQFRELRRWRQYSDNK